MRSRLVEDDPHYFNLGAFALGPDPLTGRQSKDVKKRPASAAMAEKVTTPQRRQRRAAEAVALQEDLVDGSDTESNGDAMDDQPVLPTAAPSTPVGRIRISSVSPYRELVAPAPESPERVQEFCCGTCGRDLSVRARPGDVLPDPLLGVLCEDFELRCLSLRQRRA